MFENPDKGRGRLLVAMAQCFERPRNPRLAQLAEVRKFFNAKAFFETDDEEDRQTVRAIVGMPPLQCRHHLEHRWNDMGPIRHRVPRTWFRDSTCASATRGSVAILRSRRSRKSNVASG